MYGACRNAFVLAAVLATGVGSVWAWGPHPDITAAALRVLPDRARWEAALGPGLLQGLTNHCWLPDAIDQDYGTFYTDDYLFFHANPRPPGHYATYAPGAKVGVLSVQEAAPVYFARALQALRMETPLNAMRQMGPLLHYVEDNGAPPHAYAPESDPWHSPMENWLDARQIDIAGYQPQVLGKTAAEALAGLARRLAALSQVTRARAERALPLIKPWRGTLAEAERQRLEAEIRPQMAPILLEAANDSARAVADIVYTLLDLGLAPAPAPAGGTLAGKVNAARVAAIGDKGARIVLLDAAAYALLTPGAALTPCVTDYGTLAISTAGTPLAGHWQGSFSLRQVPGGTYRVLACRTGSAWQVSAPVSIEPGQAVTVDLALAPTSPPGNIIENPDLSLCYLAPRRTDWPEPWPDRWLCVDPTKGVWQSQGARVLPQAACRCGAVLKDASVRLRFRFYDQNQKAEEVLLEPGTLTPAEVIHTYAGAIPGYVTVVIESPKPWREALERVWVVPASSPPGP